MYLSGHYIFSIKFEAFFLITKILIDDSLFLSLTSRKKNVILYSIFDHLTFGGWGIFLFVKKKPRI
jgi:hypothetical protein